MSKFERKQIYRLNGLVSKKANKNELITLIKKLAPVAPDGIPLIRMGSEYDGGYLIPDDLDGIQACFSPGVGGLIDFEQDCFARGMNVFLADNTIDGNNLPLDKFHYTNKNIASYTNETLMTIDDWVNISGVNGSSDLLLQMDIEGAEYAAISSLSDTLLNRFRILAIEFHGLHNLWNQDFFGLANEVFGKLLQTHYCVHIHPNNCDSFVEKDGLQIPITAELTFLRKDRVRSFQKVTTLPHPLDTDNAPELPSLRLSKIWYT
ncbi:MAG: FkbM family methyltransferase [Flavobacteriaceae bacterium]